MKPTRRNTCYRTILLGIALSVTGLVAADPVVERIELGTLPGGQWSEAYDINNAGKVVGLSSHSTGKDYFVWQNGEMTALGINADDLDNNVARINARGQIIGNYWLDMGQYIQQLAFVWQRGYVTVLDTLGGTETRAWNINNRGDIVGWSRAANGNRHAVMWRGGSIIDLGAGFILPADINHRGQVVASWFGAGSFLYYRGEKTDLGSLGGERTDAYALNEQGQVVGDSYTADGQRHAFLWQDGIMIDLGSLGGNWSSASAINHRGQVVGRSHTASGETHGFLWQDGVMTDLGTLGGASSIARDINNRGQIVGESRTADGSVHAVLWWQQAITDLGAGEAHAINDSGTVVGTSRENGTRIASIWRAEAAVNNCRGRKSAAPPKCRAPASID